MFLHILSHLSAILYPSWLLLSCGVHKNKDTLYLVYTLALGQRSQLLGPERDGGGGREETVQNNTGLRRDKENEGLGRGSCASVLLIVNSLDEPPCFLPLISGFSMVFTIIFFFLCLHLFNFLLNFEDSTIKWELDNMKDGIRYELAC